MIPPSVKAELYTLSKGFIAAVAAGAMLGAMQFIGAHVVPELHALLMWLAAYGGIKTT